MKFNLPGILRNPNKFDYSLDDLEIVYFQDAKRELLKKYYSLVLKSIWKAVLSNLKRRVKLYGTNDFIDNLNENEKNIYFKNSYNLSEKLSLLNNETIIKNCLKLNIISGKTYTIINFFHIFSKNNTSEPVIFEDVISIVTLLEKNLFKLKINYNVPEIYSTQSKLPVGIDTPKEKIKRKEDLNIQAITQKRRKNDVINNQTKKIKKEDLFIMQESSVPRRRTNDFMSSTDIFLKRRKNDVIPMDNSQKRRKKDISTIDTIPKRRKEDPNIEENPFLQRKRRKNDYFGVQTIPNPRRRRQDD